MMADPVSRNMFQCVIYKICMAVFGRIISAVVVGAVFGSKWITLSRPCQRTPDTSNYRILSQEMKTGSRHTNMEVLLSRNQANRRPSQYFVRLTSKQIEQRSLPAAFQPNVWPVGGVDYANRTKEQTGIGTQ